MRFDEMINSEIAREFEHFRWIGDQQKRVFTVYSTTVSAPLVVLGLLAKMDSRDYLMPWLGLILSVLGLAGVYLSFSFVVSKSFQHRISFYINELIVQLADLSPSYLSIKPAVRFRQLRSNRGRFTAQDTGNIATTLLLIQGLTLTFFGLGIIASEIWCWYSPNRLLPIGIAMIAAVLVLHIIQRIVMYFLMCRFLKEYHRVRRHPGDWKRDEIHHFLPKRSPWILRWLHQL